MIRYVSVALLPFAMLASADEDTPRSDVEAITKTALDYGQGWYEGDAEQMERALHPDLAKRVLMPDPRTGKGKIEHMSALRLVQFTRRGGRTRTPKDKRKTTVTILDVVGHAVSVKLEMHDWIDYMHMSKVDGRWVIVNVLWELTPEAKMRKGDADKS